MHSCGGRYSMKEMPGVTKARWAVAERETPVFQQCGTTGNPLSAAIVQTARAIRRGVLDAAIAPRALGFRSDPKLSGAPEYGEAGHPSRIPCRFGAYCAAFTSFQTFTRRSKFSTGRNHTSLSA